MKKQGFFKYRIEILQKKQSFVVLLLFFFLFSVLISSSTAQSSEESLNREMFSPNSKNKKYSIELLPEWKKIERGIYSQNINLFNQSKEIEVQLKLYRFNPAFFNIRVMCSKNYGQKRIDVKTLAKLSGTVAIINSSYFDKQGNPLAYLRCNGNLVNSRVVSHSLYSGVFFVKHGRPHIVHSSKFNPATGVSEAVQVGPRLISKGKNTVGLKNIYAIHHRSGIALDRKGNVIIYATNSQYGGVSWDTLRDVLKLKKIGGYEVLNLDGGGSTQMYISTDNFKDYIRGMTPIPSAIAFFYKK